MQVIIENGRLPEKGQIELNIQRTFNIHVTAEKARRKVNLWLLTDVSDMLGADIPELLLGDRVAWRVPVSIGSVQFGDLGRVGFVDVDVETGEMTDTAQLKTEIECASQEKLSRLPPLQLKETPTAYLATNVPRARTLELPEENLAITPSHVSVG